MLIDGDWPTRPINNMQLGDIVNEIAEIYSRKDQDTPPPHSILYMRYLSDRDRMSELVKALNNYGLSINKKE